MTDLAYQKTSFTHVHIQRGGDLIVFPPDEGAPQNYAAAT